MGIPADNIHFLVVQLANNILHPLPTQTDARTDRIDFFIACPNGEFGAEPGLAGDPFDFDGAVIDFRNFELEELDNEARVSPGQDDLGPVRTLLDGFDIAADAFADLILFGGHASAAMSKP